MDDWKTILSFWDGLFSELLLLVSGRVYIELVATCVQLVVVSGTGFHRVDEHFVGGIPGD